VGIGVGAHGAASPRSASGAAHLRRFGRNAGIVINGSVK